MVMLIFCIAYTIAHIGSVFTGLCACHQHPDVCPGYANIVPSEMITVVPVFPVQQSLSYFPGKTRPRPSHSRLVHVSLTSVTRDQDNLPKTFTIPRDCLQTQAEILGNDNILWTGLKADPWICSMKQFTCILKQDIIHKVNRDTQAIWKSIQYPLYPPPPHVTGTL